MSEKRTVTVDLSKLKNTKALAMMIILVLAVGAVSYFTDAQITLDVRLQMLVDMHFEEINSTWYAHQQPVSYLISNVTSGGTNYFCAQNGTTGKLESWYSTTAMTLLQTAVDNLDPLYGGSIVIKPPFFAEGELIVDRGNISIISNLERPAGYNLQIERIYLNATANAVRHLIFQGIRTRRMTFNAYGNPISDVTVEGCNIENRGYPDRSSIIFQGDGSSSGYVYLTYFKNCRLGDSGSEHDLSKGFITFDNLGIGTSQIYWRDCILGLYSTDSQNDRAFIFVDSDARVGLEISFDHCTLYASRMSNIDFCYVKGYDTATDPGYEPGIGMIRLESCSFDIGPITMFSLEQDIGVHEGRLFGAMLIDNQISCHPHTGGDQNVTLLENSCTNWDPTRNIFVKMTDNEIISPENFELGNVGSGIELRIYDNVGLPNLFSEASWVVFQDGSYTCMQSGSTGTVTARNTNASQIINWAIENLTVGRDWKQKVLLYGNFTIDNPIDITGDNYTVLETIGKITEADGANCDLLEIAGATHDIEIVGGEWDGNRANNDANTACFDIDYLNDSVIRDVWLHDPDCLAGQETSAGRCMDIGYSFNVDIVRLKATDFTKCAVHVNPGSQFINIIDASVQGDGNSYEGIVFYGSESNPIYDCSVTNGKFYNIGKATNLGVAIHCYQWAYRTTISLNKIYMNPVDAASAIGSQHNDCDFNIVSGNTIYCGGASYGIRWTASDHNLNIGNIIYYPQADGMSESGCVGNQFIDNDVYINADNQNGITSSTSSETVIRGNLIDASAGGSYQKGIWIVGTGDDSVIHDNVIIGPLERGIVIDDGDDITVQDNRLRTSTVPIDIDDADCVRIVIMGNNWEGCTGNSTYTSAVDPRIHANIDTNGGWWTVDDL